MTEPFSSSGMLTAFRSNRYFFPQLKRSYKSDLFTEERRRGRSQYLTWSSTSFFAQRPKRTNSFLQGALDLTGLEDEVPHMKATEKKNGHPGFSSYPETFRFLVQMVENMGCLHKTWEILRTNTWTGNIYHVGMGTTAPEMPRPSPSWPHLQTDT